MTASLFVDKGLPHWLLIKDCLIVCWQRTASLFVDKGQPHCLLTKDSLIVCWQRTASLVVDEGSASSGGWLLLSPAQLQAPADHFLHHFLHKARHLLTTSFIKPGNCWPLPTEIQASADHFLQRPRHLLTTSYREPGNCWPLPTESQAWGQCTLLKLQTDHRQPQPHVGNPDRRERGTIYPDRGERGRSTRTKLNGAWGEWVLSTWTKGTPVPRTVSVSTRRLCAISDLTGQPQTPAGNGQRQLETVNTSWRRSIPDEDINSRVDEDGQQ